jgi:IclR family pca regulon transcriptional regulator
MARRPVPRRTGAPAATTSDRAQSLYKGLLVLQSFSRRQTGMTLSEVAAAVGLNRATTRRFLLTLLDLGYVETDGKVYRLTPKVMTLGYTYLASLPWWQLASPVAEELSRRLEESCSIGVLSGDQLIFVARVQGPRLLAIHLTPGRSVPVHVTAIGRVLLAERTPEEIDRFLARTPLERLTPHTVTDPEALKAALREIREKGYAVIDQELEPGLRAIGVPVRDRSGRAVAAIGMSTHVQRRTLAELERDLLPHIRAGAERIRDLLPR